MKLATELLEAIDEELAKDGGNSYRLALAKHLPQESDIYRVETGGPRKHLGPSGLGKDCMRSVWYQFRHVRYTKPSPRLIRLFNRGHMEEPRLRALLDIVGVQFSTRGVKYRSENGLYAMTSDGLIRRVPGLPRAQKVVPEFKTYNDKRFKTLCKKGVEQSDPNYYDQVQAYLKRADDVTKALFIAVNKNTDEIHAEWINQQEEWQDSLEQKANLIIKTDTPPPKISEESVFFKCKMCDFAKICHKKEQPDVNCRTCAHWEAGELGPRCVKKNKYLQDELGCDQHVYNPHLVPLEYIGGDGNNALYSKSNIELTNGPDGVSSYNLWEHIENDGKN